jgi:hypothetical protein
LGYVPLFISLCCGVGLYLYHFVVASVSVVWGHSFHFITLLWRRSLLCGVISFILSLCCGVGLCCAGLFSITSLSSLYQGNEDCKGGCPFFYPRDIGQEAVKAVLEGKKDCRPLLISVRVGHEPTVEAVEALAPDASERLGGYRVLPKTALSDYSLDAGILFI